MTLAILMSTFVAMHGRHIGRSTMRIAIRAACSGMGSRLSGIDSIGRAEHLYRAKFCLFGGPPCAAPTFLDSYRVKKRQRGTRYRASQSSLRFRRILLFGKRADRDGAIVRAK